MEQAKNLIIIILMALFTVACTRVTTITNGDIQLKVDNKMRFNVQSLNQATASFFNGFVASDALFADEFTASQFNLKTINSSEAEQYTFTGTFEYGNYRLSKEQVIGIPARQPGMLTIETRYINDGSKPVALRGWKCNELRVHVADTSVWSFQPSSTNQRMDWALEVKPGFYKKNYLGMNNSDYGGGIPVVNLWRRDGGVATGITEPVLKMASMPVEWKQGEDFACMALTYEFPERFVLAPGDTLRLFDTFISVHQGDFYNPLHQFTCFMEDRHGFVFPPSPPEAYEAVWCAWGYERTFTIQEVLQTLPKVAELGFKWVDIDDGYQQAEGDWEPNTRFPGGDRDMRRMTDAVRAYGMRSKLWWAPLAADPDSKILSVSPTLRLTTGFGGPQWISWWNSFYLSPVNPYTERYTNELLERFILTWGFDGLKLDGQHLNLCLPDYNRASRLRYPNEAVERMPEYFKNIYDRVREYKDYAVIQFCPCGCAINFFMIPYINQAVSSDPLSSLQVRQKGKAYRAINDKLAYYADHIELSDNGNDFGTQIGIGGVIGSKFTWPKDNPDVRTSYLLTPEKEVLYKKWVTIYNDKMIGAGSYLNLYDMGYDKPETHVLTKDGKMYYAFYAKQWNGEPVTLRGLEKNRRYTVCEYTSDEKKTYPIDGANPVITPTFTRNYLIEVY